MNSLADVHPAGIVDLFAVPGTLVSLQPHGSGHINRTFLSEFSDAGSRMRYIHQRINDKVFPRPDLLMDNVQRILAFQAQKNLASGLPDAARRSMTLVPSRQGGPFARDPQGGWWRTYRYIERTKVYSVLETPAQARAIAQAVGRFQLDLADFPPPRLHETIPRFHDAGRRYQAFREALEADRMGRSSLVRAEIEWFQAQETASSVISEGLASGRLPERITHNDTKSNNILVDQDSGEGLCVIDLDTVMPGSLLYDFGDLVRTGTATVEEDAPDAQAMEMNLALFGGLLDGFCAQTAGILSASEKELLPIAGRVLTTIIGLRFLTDFLNGDRYFRIGRPDHNLDRTRTQIALVQSMDRQRPLIHDLCGQVLSRPVPRA